MRNFPGTRIEKIRSAPQVLLELLDALHKPVADLDEVSRIVELDPAFSARILQLARTLLPAPCTRVSRLRPLVGALGLQEVRRIALTSAVHQHFGSFPPEEDRLLEALWIHPLLCGDLARDLAQLAGYPRREEAYTAGILSRIGELALWHAHGDRYRDILYMEGPAEVRERMERELFSMSYSEAGAALARDWPLHPFLADAVLYQNKSPDELGDASTLVQLINLATRLTRNLTLQPDDESAWDDPFFGLNRDLLKEVAANGRTRTMEAARNFGIQAEGYLGAKRTRPEEMEEATLSARRRLADYVHQAALAGTRQEWPETISDRSEALDQIRRDLAIVFGLQGIRFLVAAPGGQLVGTEEEKGEGFFEDLSLDPEKSPSLAAKSLQDAKVRCTLQRYGKAPNSTFDQQLAHLFGADGVLFLPLVEGETFFGVAVAGLSEGQWEALKPRVGLLEFFLRHLSQSFSRTLYFLETRDRQREEREDWQKLEIRKILHEVNNPLSIINNYLYTLSTKLDEEDSAESDLEVLREEIERIGDILSRLKEIGAPQQPADGVLHLNRTIGELVKLFEYTLLLERDIRVETDLDDSIPTLLLGAGAVKQVLINLIKNAAEAMPSGGALHIATRDKIYKGGTIYVELQLWDDGPGLPEAVLDSLFQPVSSTKRDHAGLGLCIVKNLVDSLSGEIFCSSSKSGTRFQILFPRRTETRTNAYEESSVRPCS